MDYEGYLNVGQIAAKMGVSEATVWNLIKQRELDRYRFPGDRRTYVTVEDMKKLTEPVKIPGATQRGRPRGTGEASKRAA